MTAPGIPVVIFILAMIVGACGARNKKPDDLLTKDEMVRAMSDLYLTEQKISTLGIKRDSLKQVFGILKERIFAKSGTTDSVFKRSLNYYMENPVAMEAIYTALIDSLNLHEQRMISNELKK